MDNYKSFTTIIVITAKDFPRLVKHYKRLVANIPARKFIFLSNDGIKDELARANLGENVSYLDENELISFDEIKSCLEDHLKDILGEDSIPRAAVGWYYQQFLKMQYAYICPDEYYMTWDGDTIPCKPFEMFSSESGAPYMDMKHEYHALYFETLEKLLPGMKKCIKKSFISEHMLFNTSIMKQLIQTIESNDLIPGKRFYEKIIHAINPARICDSGFSEFETYGTFVAFTRPDLYKLRDWHSFRLAASFFDPDTICDRDYDWLARDFHAISFEKNQSVREDNKNLFDNPEYQAKLSARQMLEIAQEEFRGGYIEVWGDDNSQLGLDPLATASHSSSEDERLFNLGNERLSINPNQAYLCYEQAHFLATDPIKKDSYKTAMDKARLLPGFSLRKTSICIVSYNAKNYMEDCIRSIRFNCSLESANIVVVDNNSSDGVLDYLRSLKGDITLIESSENLGFPKGCNECIKAADADTDIFLLNNDTRMTHNALFWLRYGLYSQDDIGACGCMGSFAGNNQMIELGYNRPEDYMEFARANNIYTDNALEEKSRLCGFAMLIRRDVLDRVGPLDEAFSPGYFEDDDLSLRIKEQGYRLCVVHNSFIYHKGSESFGASDQARLDRVNAIMARNYEYSIGKYGYDNLSAATIFNDELSVLRTILEDKVTNFSFLEIGAGSGNFLSMLRYHFKEATLLGTSAIDGEINHAVKNVDIIKYDPLKDNLDCPSHSFDYILVRTYSSQDAQITPLMAKEKYAHLVKENGRLLYISC